MIKAFNNILPEINDSAFIDREAQLIGDVRIGKCASVWPGAVLRGDVSHIIIGENSNIQDGVIIHTNINMPVLIGKNVTIGHGVILHGCSISDFCLIGMGAIILDQAQVGRYCIVAAGSVVPEGKSLDSGVYMGIPAKKTREITDSERKLIEDRALEYIELSKYYG